MPLIDIESAKKVISDTISQLPSSTAAATLTPTLFSTTPKLFEYPLRSISSFPYILEKSSTTKMEKENSHQAYDEIMYQTLNAVQFNAGCSSSSTDLDKLIEFYNSHSDEETLAQWMTIYEEQKLANSISAASKRGSGGNHHHGGYGNNGGESNLSHFKNRKFLLCLLKFFRRLRYLLEKILKNLTVIFFAKHC